MGVVLYKLTWCWLGCCTTHLPFFGYCKTLPTVVWLLYHLTLCCMSGSVQVLYNLSCYCLGIVQPHLTSPGHCTTLPVLCGYYITTLWWLRIIQAHLLLCRVCISSPGVVCMSIEISQQLYGCLTYFCRVLWNIIFYCASFLQPHLLLSRYCAPVVEWVLYNLSCYVGIVQAYSSCSCIGWCASSSAAV